MTCRSLSVLAATQELGRSGHDRRATLKDDLLSSSRRWCIRGTRPLMPG